ncbi:MAG: PH domain-containing protein [Actinomycetota bacterium]
MSLNLAAGERVIFEGHPSWRAIVAFYLKGILIAAVLGAIIALATNVFGDDANKGLVFLVVVAVIGFTVLIGFIKRVSTTYTITDRRLNIKRGIVSREVQETRLERVQNVNYDQGVLQRILQVGDVNFDTAGSGDYDFSFDGVADPGVVVQKVDEAQRAHDAGTHGLGEPRTETAPTQVQPPEQPPPQQPPPQQ